MIRAVTFPYALAGGIATTTRSSSALALGAAGVSVGTRFIASEESDAHEAYKRAVARPARARPCNTSVHRETVQGAPHAVRRILDRPRELRSSPTPSAAVSLLARTSRLPRRRPRRRLPANRTVRRGRRRDPAGGRDRRDARRGGAPGMNEGWRGSRGSGPSPRRTVPVLGIPLDVN